MKISMAAGNAADAALKKINVPEFLSNGCAGGKQKKQKCIFHSANEILKFHSPKFDADCLIQI